MFYYSSIERSVLAILTLGLFASLSLAQETIQTDATPVLWRDPGNVSARDLGYGPGSSQLAPAPPFIFIEEDKTGESPKFSVKDRHGITWAVKMGEEAPAETVATRLVWAVGYFAEEAYYFDRITVQNLPQLSRGRQHIEGQSVVRRVRLEPRRGDVVRGPKWDWDNNPFAGTRELSGLKVLMILLNNYDARPENNRVFYVNNRREARFVVTDLGATLGRAGGLGGRRSKNNLADFHSTRFVMGVDDGAVKFDYDTRPTGLGMFSIVYFPYYLGQVKKEKSMRGIPVEHALWIGGLLSQLTDQQLRASFQSAGYDRATTDGYVKELRARINQLTRLKTQQW